MKEQFKGYDLLRSIEQDHPEYYKKISLGLQSGKIRFFNDTEWEKIKNQNFFKLKSNVNSFYDYISLGYNIGDCLGCAITLSYSYNDADIVAGCLPILIGTKNSDEFGKHAWIENNKEIIDTSLLLVIDKSLKDELGYKEEIRKNRYFLAGDSLYQARKELVNDTTLRRKK